jgi:hypothetical protein
MQTSTTIAFTFISLSPTTHSLRNVCCYWFSLATFPSFPSSLHFLPCFDNRCLRGGGGGGRRRRKRRPRRRWHFIFGLHCLLSRQTPRASHLVEDTCGRIIAFLLLSIGSRTTKAKDMSLQNPNFHARPVLATFYSMTVLPSQSS